MDLSAWGTQAPALEKTSELYIRDEPHRSIAIVSSSHALILRYSQSANEGAPDGPRPALPAEKPHTAAVQPNPAKCMVEFSPVSKRLMQDYRPLAPRPIYGTLGMISINGEVFLAVITNAVRAATIRPGETVERISSVAFYSLSSAGYDDVVPLESLDSDMSDVMFASNGSLTFGPALGRRDVTMEHPCRDIRKLLSNGSFYYSTDFDVTNRLQDRPINSNSFEIDNFDHTYLWNSFLIKPLAQFRARIMPQDREALDSSRMLTLAIRGFCETVTLPQRASPLRTSNEGRPALLTLISRLSCKKAGTRFNSRGIDDDGHAANFVETETTFWSPPGTLFSYAQVRGSVPIFWEQIADLMPGRQKITVTRSLEGTQPALDKHFERLEHTYGAVHVIDLLSATKASEKELSDLYRRGTHNCPLSKPEGNGSKDHALLRETHYDFHAETKGPAGYEAARHIRRFIENSVDGFAYYLAEETHDDENRGKDKGMSKGKSVNDARMIVVLQQEGVFRTNCLDCLDRTNFIQTLISQMAVEAFLSHRGQYAASDFWMRHSTLWADNGDSLSKIYAGTGALKTSFTRHGKMSLAGAVADMRKSMQRIYHNNFVDPSRQATMDTLLGRNHGQVPTHLFDPISDFVSVELGKRSKEFISFQSISIWAGTSNLNGRMDGLDHDLSPWLAPPDLGDEQHDIYAVAFQEIVELSPQQIMNSDPSRKYLWEQAVKRCLNERQAALRAEEYILLRSGQLVGAALCLFVKTSVLGRIKNVEGSVKKTGLSGMAGNKGAVAIRLDFANTPICFVTAHMAAGFANYDERNRDYATIHSGLRFQRSRGIEDHDAIVWLGDFNYRIGLGQERARALIQKRDLAALYENDQLNLQMVAGLAFRFYSEARIGFMPTYKFDVGTDNYDSSEKARIPAWTDRVLRKGAILRQLSYDSAPLRFSDHRPVYATFACKVCLVDEMAREKISRDLYEARKAEVGQSTAHVGDGEETEDEELIGYEAVEPGLPPASSDRQKWWLDNGQLACAQVATPRVPEGQRVALNPRRPSNPFGHSDEPDWISVSYPSTRASISSVSSSPRDKTANGGAQASMAMKQERTRIAQHHETADIDVAAEQRLKSQGVPGVAKQPGILPGTEPPPPPPPRRQGTAPIAPKAELTSVEKAPAAMARAPLRHVPKHVPTHANPLQVSQSDHPFQGGGKAVPPVAKKPAHLLSNTSPSTNSSPTTPTTHALTNETGTSMSQAPASTSWDTASSALPRGPAGTFIKSGAAGMRKMQPASGPARRAITGQSLNARTQHLNGTDDLQPPLPARALPTNAPRQEPAATKGLLDSSCENGEGEMSGWETLLPSR